MSEVHLENDAQTVPDNDNPDFGFDPVCIDVPRIYDSCGAKDCLRDLTVFFTEADQAMVEKASAVRVSKASVLTSSIAVDAVAFNRGYDSVDVVFYFAVCVEVYAGTGAIPTTATGLATASKRVVLYGSDASTKTFSGGDTTAPIDTSDFDCCPGCPSTLPDASVQVSCPMALAASVTAVTAPVIMPFVPENVAEFFGEAMSAPESQQVLVTLGTFSIVQLTRNVQLMIPSYDFCVPRKECAADTSDPCEAFSKIEFPTDSFFPPSTTDTDTGTPFHCGCE